MSENKGKPSGKFAEEKTDPGRKGNYQRTGWPEDDRRFQTASREDRDPRLVKPPPAKPKKIRRPGD